jgi:hypothetical protein
MAKTSWKLFKIKVSQASRVDLLGGILDTIVNHLDQHRGVLPKLHLKPVCLLYLLKLILVQPRFKVSIFIKILQNLLLMFI